MNEVNKSGEEIKKRNHKMLWIMVVVFGLPYVVAFYFYFNKSDYDFSTTNYGTIVSPARALPDFTHTKLDNSEFKISSLKGKWVLLSIGKSSCQKDCVDNLYKIRQIKKAVGQNHKRITKLFMLQDKQHLESFKRLLKEYPGMDVIVPSGNEYNNYLSNFQYDGIELEDSMFVIDPMGNYMMVYPKGADASKILKDVERLLRVSKVG